jgi:Tfp pilus assembly protein PilX
MTHQPLRRERGVTLVVGLIMLVVITLLVVATFTLSRSNFEIVGNMQHHNEARASAQRAIEEVISSPLLTTNPGNIFQPPCSGQNNTKCYNVTKDSTNTTADQIVVTLTPTPTCVKAEVVKSANLDVSKLGDQHCVVQQNQQFGVENVEGADSLCADSTWEVRAVATDAATKAQSVITQGVATRVRAVDVAAACP